MNTLRRQQGLTLIELLISMVISLVIIAGVAQVFLGGRAAYNLQQRVGDLQENGRFALYYLQRSIRMAGFPAFTNGVPATADVAFNTVVDNPIVVVCPSPLGTVARTCDGGGAVSDEITVSYQGITDCLGQNVNGGATGTVTDTYFIDTRRLMCRGNGAAQAQPLVEGVENMQILYGEDCATSTAGAMDCTLAGTPLPLGWTLDGYANRYVRADEVAVWTHVVSVRIAILASTINTVMGDSTSAAAQPTFQLLDMSGIGPLPAAVRGRVFTTTIEVRNRTS